MKLKSVLAMTVAGLWLAGVCGGTAHGGWFGFGDSNNASKTSKSQPGSSRTSIGTAKPAPSSSKSSSGGIGGLFGLGKQSTSTQPTKKITNPYTAKGAKEKTSWWDSLFKPKEPPPPKSTREWMKLKQVKY